MEKFRTVGDWLQIGANIGILIGLILVGFQMKQNSELLQVQLLKDELVSYLDSEMAIIGDDYGAVWEKMITSPEEMTLREMRIEEAMLWGHGMMRWINTYRLGELGLVNEDQWKTEVQRDASFFFGNRYGRAWWDTLWEETQTNVGNPHQYIPFELANYIQEYLESSPENYTEEYLNRTKENLEKHQLPSNSE